ncbi:MAG: amidohydrolase [Bacteroidia bacterium]
MNNNNLTVSIIQADLAWEDKEKNLKKFSDKINKITSITDVIVLPEMFTTGFSMQAELLAEPMDGRTMNWMKTTANKKNCVLTGSFICKENGCFFNRLIWMNPNGSYIKYDKRHLFSMGNENRYYSAGQEKVIVELKGWKICPLICYDLRFPVWSRNSKDNPYDLLIYIANWPQRRSLAWNTLLVARAIENQCYVMGVNRVGMDGNAIEHVGGSAVITAAGELISSITSGEESEINITLNYSALIEFRKIFPALADSDCFQIGE